MFLHFFSAPPRRCVSQFEVQRRQEVMRSINHATRRPTRQRPICRFGRNGVQLMAQATEHRIELSGFGSLRSANPTYGYASLPVDMLAFRNTKAAREFKVRIYLHIHKSHSHTSKLHMPTCVNEGRYNIAFSSFFYP